MLTTGLWFVMMDLVPGRKVFKLEDVYYFGVVHTHTEPYDINNLINILHLIVALP